MRCSKRRSRRVIVDSVNGYPILDVLRAEAQEVMRGRGYDDTPGCNLPDNKITTEADQPPPRAIREDLRALDKENRQS